MSDTQESLQLAESSTEMQTVVSSYISDIGNIHANDTYTYADICGSEGKVDDDKEIEVDVTEGDSNEQNVWPCEDRNNEQSESKDPFESWHPHVYGKPPKMPTPHTIEYILGMNKDSKKTVTSLLSVKRFVHERDNKLVQNRLQEQLLLRSRNSDSACAKEEPLNLSVPKTWCDEERLSKGKRVTLGKKGVYRYVYLYVCDCVSLI